MIEEKKDEIKESSLDTSSTNFSVKETTIRHRSEIPQAYFDFNFLEIKKSDIEKINKECLKCKNSHNLMVEILTNLFLGISTTLFGVILSGIFNVYNDAQWQFWFTYLVCPILCLIFFFAYILMLIYKKNKKDKPIEVVTDKLLEPSGLLEDKNNE